MHSCSLNARRVVINPHAHLTKSLRKSRSVMPGRTRESNRTSKSDTVGPFAAFVGALMVGIWTALMSASFKEIYIQWKSQIIETIPSMAYVRLRGLGCPRIRSEMCITRGGTCSPGSASRPLNQLTKCVTIDKYLERGNVSQVHPIYCTSAQASLLFDNELVSGHGSLSWKDY
jgi:hypothetical protein